MCNNIIVLYIFIFLKIIAVVILPIAIFIFRKKEFNKYIIKRRDIRFIYLIIEIDNIDF